MSLCFLLDRIDLISLPLKLFLPLSHIFYFFPSNYIYVITIYYIRNYALANNYDITGTFPIRVDPSFLRVNPSTIIYVIMPFFPSK